MRWFRRTRPERSPEIAPTPFIAEVLRRIGEEYGGFDSMSPLPPERGGPGMEVVVHIAGETRPDRPEFSHGTGILRTALVFADRTEVYTGGPPNARFGDEDERDEAVRQIGRFDDLTTEHLVGRRPIPAGEGS